MPLDFSARTVNDSAAVSVPIATVGTTGPYGVHDTLRTSTFASVPSLLATPHPLYASLVDSQEEALTRRKAFTVSNGLHMAVRTKFEEIIARDALRLPTCLAPSSSIATSVVAGTDDSLDFCDVLNLPHNAAHVRMPMNM